LANFSQKLGKLVKITNVLKIDKNCEVGLLATVHKRL
jgi:hypothetical protein